MSDFRQALRSLRRTPSFTVAAVATLALGIGATTAIFTVVNAALFRPLPYPDPGRLVVLTVPAARDITGQLFLHVRDRVQAIESVAAQASGNNWNLSARNVVTYARSLRVSDAFFATHGVRPLLGREFSRAEDSPGGPDVVVISETLWRREFDASPDAIGRALLLGSAPHEVVGVIPDSFRSIPDVDVWTPLRTTLLDSGQNYRVVGRLQSKVTPAQAEAELSALRSDIREAFPRYSPEYVAVLHWMPYREFLSSGVRQTFLILLGAVGFLLLIACVNVASLQLTRSLGRRHEMALRATLGASRVRLVGQVLAESLALAAIGAIAGLSLALAGTRLLASLVSEQMSAQMLSGETVSVDWRVLGFTTVVSLLCGILFGIAPAFMSSRADLRSHASEGVTSTASRRTVWLRRSLAGAEIALALVLLVGAGLLVRTLVNLMATDPGFTPRGIMVGRMSLQGAIETPQFDTAVRQGLDRVRQIPGIAAAAVGNVVPVERGLNLPLAPPAGSRITQARAVDWRHITPDYFTVFGIALLAGRAFDDADRAGGRPVAIVNEAFARAYFGRLDVIGEAVSLVQGFPDPPRQIVGVVADVKARSGSGWTRGLTALGSDVAPTLFVPSGQALAPPAGGGGPQRVWDITWAFKIETARPTLEREIQAAVRAVDARMTFLSFESMGAVIDRDLDVPRLVAGLLTGFGALALLLAAIGLYGMMAYSTAQRVREVGIRMAFGATEIGVLQRFLSEGLVVAASGIALGVVGAASISRVLAALLFGVTPLDIMTFAGALVLLLGVAAVATIVPAARAARLDPVRALRSE